MSDVTTHLKRLNAAVEKCRQISSRFIENQLHEPIYRILTPHN